MRVLEVEAALTLFDLVLVIDDFENTRPQLGSDLAEDSVGFEALDDKVLQFVHFGS